MHRASRVLFLLAITAWMAGCGSVAPTAPTAPSAPASVPPTAPPTFPSLLGDWRGLVGGQVIHVETGQQIDFNLFCSQNWQFSTQAEGTFTGLMSSRGQSPESDWRCAHNSELSGQLGPGDAVTIRLAQPYRPGGCSEVIGPATLSGRMTSNDTITIDFTGRATCELLMGRTGNQRDVEFRVTFSLTRR